jgi:hypothetical protein
MSSRRFGWRVPLAFVLALTISGCSSSPAGSSSPADPRLPETAVQTWFYNGKAVPSTVIDMGGGAAHCGMERMTLLFLGWPLGDARDDREYFRDPSHWFSPYQAGPGHTFDSSLLDLHAKLPSDTKATGYTSGPVELYLSATDENRVAYLVGLGTVERWPRIDPPVRCL